MAAKAKTKRISNPKRKLDTTLYTYVEKSNKKHAETFGVKLFGSSSAYVNALIAKDRGVKPALGIKQAKI